MQFRHRMDPVRCTVKRYLLARFCRFWFTTDGLTGLMTLCLEYPSENHKRLSLKVKSQSCGMKIGASEVEPSSVVPSQGTLHDEAKVAPMSPFQR